MKTRPTIALCLIMKDEMFHLKDMLKSVENCFDEIHIVDTGSTDGSLEFVRSYEASQVAGAPIFVKEFKWIDDFAAARNYSMDGVTTDYVMWMDLDDRMSDRAEFIKWRNEVMMLADYWMAPYYYSFDEKGNPNCTFIRERVINNKKKFAWEYAIHEGMIAKEPVHAQYVKNWHIKHARTKEDYEKDFSRNVSILEKLSKKGELPVRLKWYYGKELFDKQKWAEAYVWLNQVIDSPELEMHDRLLNYEYLVRACIQRYHNEEAHKPNPDKSLLAKGLSLIMQATVLSPLRAEYWCLAGDCLVNLGRANEAIPMFHAAMNCHMPGPNDPSFIFSNSKAYTYVPLNMIASIKFHAGDLNGAIFTAKECFEKFGAKETEDLLQNLLKMKENVDKFERKDQIETNDIVFTCAPGSHPYKFDEEIYKTKGIGGSETALVEVAKWIKHKTFSRVIVFNDRDTVDVQESGVEYRPSNTMGEYFSKYKPEVHVSWRHNIKLTDAPTYLWCHDLYTPGGENHKNYVKHICLSEFHKNYVQCEQLVPSEKIHISRNGVEPKRFEGLDFTKDENKVVFPSSPDRGLDRAIRIVEIARQTNPNLELHAYYGLDNMKKGHQHFKDLAVKLEKMIAERPWVKFHGNVDQKTLANELAKSPVWLYPANFIESYCITVLEAMYCKTFALCRHIGALKNTVKPFADRGWAKLLFNNAETEEDLRVWADELLDTLKRKPWENINMNEFDYTWEGVAKDFMTLMNIEEDRQEVVSQLVHKHEELGGNAQV